MAKVILDFPNLRQIEDGPAVQEHLDRMAERAKRAKGFLVFFDFGEASGLQMYGLSPFHLASLVNDIFEDQPEVKLVLSLHDRMDSLGR